MKTLGKILILLFLTNITLFGSVQASVDSTVVYSGELITYKLSMSGDDIIKPVITKICGNDVVSSASQTSIESINGNYNRTYTLSYQFMPQKSCVIEPIEVEISGKIEKSNSVKFTVKEPSQDKKAPFTLELTPSKSDLYVGEPFELTLTLKQKLNAQAVDSKFIAPDFKGFWIKSESKPTRVDNGEDIVTTILYTLSAQRDENLTISPAQLRIASRESGRDVWGSFGYQVKWRTYYSNKLTLNIKPIPNAAKIIGDLSIDVKVDKNEINANEALNVTVEVDGIGNLEDIKSFKPYLKNVNVFDEKISINGNKLTQKLAFVSDKDFSIPAFELLFFNTKTQKLQKIKTQIIPIKVNGSGVKKELNIKRETQESVNTKESLSTSSNEVNYKWIVAAFLVGLALGIVLMLIKSLKFSSKEKKFNIKNEKLLLVKLLPYKDDKEVQILVDILENNLYSTTKQEVDKKLLKEIIKKYSIS